MRTQGARITCYFRMVAVRSWSTKLISRATSHRSVMRKLRLGATRLPEEREDPINCTIRKNLGPRLFLEIETVAEETETTGL
jgi:hypothetical protein